MKAPERTAVNFDSQPLQVAESPICIPGGDAADIMAAHRTSRHIDFVDDGKLFEGHFTLHTRGLKSLIQLLVDQQSEQRVIINDLQDQLNMLRQQTTKMRKAATASTAFASRSSNVSSGSALKEVDDLRRRVKQLEGFQALWGLRATEVENLISTYGDPVVTPEEYTACLLNLKPFRMLRSDTRNSIVTQIERRQSITARTLPEERIGRVHGARDRSARDDSRGARDRNARDDSRNARDESRVARDDSRGARDRNARGDDHHARDARDESRGARDRNARDDAREARDESRGARDESRNLRDRNARGRNAPEDSRGGREEAHFKHDDEGDNFSELTCRVEALERKLGRGSTATHSSRHASNAAPRSSVSSGEVVDEQAREDLEELERFVIRRFKEVERSLSKSRDATPASATSAAGVAAASTAVKGSGQPVGRYEKSPARYPTGPPETGSSATNISTKNNENNNDVSGVSDMRSRRERKPPKDGGVVDQVAREDAFAALDHVEQLEKFVNRKLKEFSLALGKGMGPGSVRPAGESEVPSSVEHKPQGPMIDQMARDDAARSLEIVQELEEDLGRRWQSLEERLRIIGRATMNKGSIASATNALIDRKAREDASMSLMRIQQIEREIVGFRRLLQRQKIPAASEETGLSDTRGSSGVMFPSPPKLQRQITLQPMVGGGVGNVAVDNAAGTGDAEYHTHMQNLEQEVELRMEEVNRALATLRSARPNSGFSELSDGKGALLDNITSIPGQVVINSKETDELGLMGMHSPLLPTQMSHTGLLVMTSHEAAGQGPITNVGEPGKADAISLRPPQMGAFSAPLVTREVQREPQSASPDALAMTAAGLIREEQQQQLLQKRGQRSAGSDRWRGGDAVSLTLEDAGGDATAAEVAAMSHLLSLKQLRSESARVAPRSRAGELDELRSHSVRLRDMSMGSPGRMEGGFSAEPSALGHTTPCVVYNCAWCAAQKRAAAPMTARPLR
ncbi:hypothetical protein DQ04_00481070 [Trypanosoma grayi]|uniref:hypothetical protein n=1 Tax=Trypanosoma grayi TaxID=71804 RepID=UPI0004F4079B|nr:hypothetical protein DQ04_00481070 [Trypanosoma grayi]KEG14412.1 hypothetical protein DQ04_00481070 [Trypanosoma grayi]